MPEHDNALCAASNGEASERPANERCLDGDVYGLCGHENCYGICEWQGTCPCGCHAPTLTRSYAAQVNAPLTCAAAREIGRQIASGNYPRYKVSEPKVVVAEKAVFVDGPIAGHIRPIDGDCHYYHVRVPRPLRLEMLMADSISIADETATYTVTTRFYATGQTERIRVQIGTVNGGDGPSEEDLAECGPTGLAEQGLIPWSAVPDTAADRISPIEIVEVGDPLEGCKVRISDPFRLPNEMIEGSCDCGWRTDYQIPMARRAQVVRAAHKHAAGQEERRARYALPIHVLDEGSGLNDFCLASYDFDKVSGLVAARCRECGWRTEKVEQYRGKPLGVLRATHIGADGVRHARNRLLTAFGLPAPTVEEEEAMRRD